jgi:hypothetical protein
MHLADKLFTDDRPLSTGSPRSTAQFLNFKPYFSNKLDHLKKVGVIGRGIRSQLSNKKTPA